MGYFDGVDLSNWGSPQDMNQGQPQPYQQPNTGQGMGGRPGIDTPQPWQQPSQPMDNGGGQQFNQNPTFTSGQGMDNNIMNFGSNLSRLAGNGNNNSFGGSGDPMESNRPLQTIGGPGLQPNLPAPGMGQPPRQQLGGQQPLFDYNDRAQQDAFVKSLGANAPAAFLDNGNMGNGGWENRYNAIKQAAMGRPISDFGPAATLQGAAPGGMDYAHPENIDWHQFQKNVFGAAGANRQFNELAGVVGDNSPALKNGWQLATPTGTPDQGKALALAYTLGQKNPNVDYSVVQTADGYNIAARPQDYHPGLPQPGMAGGAGGAAQRYSGGGGGNNNYRTNLPPAGGGAPANMGVARDVPGATLTLAKIIANSIHKNPLPAPGAVPPISNYPGMGAIQSGANVVADAVARARAGQAPYVSPIQQGNTTPDSLGHIAQQQQPQGQGRIVELPSGGYGVVDGYGNVQPIGNSPSSY